jgi:hypothetical protein
VGGGGAAARRELGLESCDVVCHDEDELSLANGVADSLRGSNILDDLTVIC